VGARIQANKGRGESQRDWRMGRAKAAVFPEPVSASAIRSLPERASGMDSAWMGVGAL